MLRAVCFMIFYLFRSNDASVTETQTIQIQPYNSNLLSSYLVKNGGALDIIFQKFVGISIECLYGNEDYNSNNFQSFNNKTARLHIIVVINAYSTQWKCNGLYSNGTRTTYYLFEIRVKRASEVHVSVYGESVVFNTTSLSETRYDGVYEYLCEEGDTIDLTCINIYGNGQIQLQYYNVNGLTIIDTRQCDKADFTLKFRMLVRDTSVNGSYVDCSYKTTTHKFIEQTFTYRTIFTVTTEPLRNDNFIVTVNGTKLAAVKNHTTGADVYIYKYIYWEALNLTCTKRNPQLQGIIHGKVNNKNNVIIKDLESTSSTYTTLIDTKNLDGAMFNCYSELNHSIVSINIKFSKETNRDPFIYGLSVSDILYEYNTGDMEWTIHYLYDRNKVLNLTCVTEAKIEPRWIYEENITSTIHTNMEYNAWYINYLFHMNTEFNKTIICESNKLNITRRMKIFLQPKSDFIDLTSKFDSFNLVEGVVLTEFEITGIVAAVVVTTIAAICAFYWRWSKRKIVTKEALYKNFNNNVNLINESNEYTYIETQDDNMVANDLYIGVDQNNASLKGMTTCSQDAENHYTEIDLNIKFDDSSNTYAVPYEIHNINQNKLSKIDKNHDKIENENHNINLCKNNLQKGCSSPSNGNLEYLYNPSYSNLINNNKDP